MSMNYPLKVVNDVIGTIDSYDQKIIEFEKKRKKPSKDKWEYCEVVLLFPVLGVSYRPPFLHMSILMFYEYNIRTYYSICNYIYD